MQMLYAMVLMIDPCNSKAGLSKISAADVFLYVFSFVPYLELNILTFFFSKYFYANAFCNDFND
jgi:hypothetical protein